MKGVRYSSRVAALLSVGLGASWAIACSDHLTDSLTGPTEQPQFSVQAGQDIAGAMAAQRRYTPALMRIPGVVGTAVGLLLNGRAAVRVFLENAEVRGLPAVLDGVPVSRQVTGRFMALSDPTTRQRPAPVGFSVGHPAITAGTFGARVKNGSGQVFVLSNNHVLANQNDASAGDPALQPGPYDGGTIANDQVGTLYDFMPIDFSFSGQNTMDAAIALTTTASMGNATPIDDGYGLPNSAIWGDANNDGVFDNKSALLGLNVQKYGRTTKLTQGQITGINATVEICYEVLLIFCIKSAYFVDQLIIEPGGFSGGGDSGSLIVTADQNKNPVGLLFAGSETQTIANRIDLVLNHFSVSVDGAGEPPPPTPLIDVAIQSVSAPSPATQGDLVEVVVTVTNVGTEDVTGPFDVTLKDTTDLAMIGTQSVTGLASGASTALTFAWNTAGSSTGSHTLIARHGFADDNAANDLGTTVVTVNPPGGSTSMHVGDLDGTAMPDGNGTTWSAVVEITVHDQNHIPLNGATVTGTWSRSGLNSNVCTTGDLGGTGTCIVLFPSLRLRNVKSVNFTVTSVTMNGVTYQATLNHDPDGDSNGTSIKVNRP